MFTLALGHRTMWPATWPHEFQGRTVLNQNGTMKRPNLSAKWHGCVKSLDCKRLGVSPAPPASLSESSLFMSVLWMPILWGETQLELLRKAAELLPHLKIEKFRPPLYKSNSGWRIYSSECLDQGLPKSAFSRSLSTAIVNVKFETSKLQVLFDIHNLDANHLLLCK